MCPINATLLAVGLLCAAPAAAAAAESPSAPALARAGLEHGFGVDSADKRFGVSLGFLGWLRYDVQRTTATTLGFQLPLARPTLRAHLWGKRLSFLLQPEFAGTPRLLDATATVTVRPAFAVQLGQFRPWFTRGFRTGLPQLALPDRGVVLDTFRVDRDIGATILGRPFGGRLEYYLGVFNGEGKNAVGDADPNVLVTARLVGAPLGPVAYDQTTQTTGAGTTARPRVAFAVNATTNEVRDSQVSTDPATGQSVEVPLPDRRDLSLGGDVAATWWRMSALAEVFWRHRYRQGVRESQAWGTYGLVSARLVRRWLDASMRVGVLQPEPDPTPTVAIEPGFNVYFAGNHAKLQVRYSCQIPAGGSRCRQHRATAQAQILF